jgi:hypothetical protein
MLVGKKKNTAGDDKPFDPDKYDGHDSNVTGRSR